MGQMQTIKLKKIFLLCTTVLVHMNTFTKAMNLTIYRLLACTMTISYLFIPGKGLEYCKVSNNSIGHWF